MAMGLSPPQGMVATTISSSSYPLQAPDGSVTAPSFSFSGSTATGILRTSTGTGNLVFEGAAILAYRLSTSATIFRVYNTWTDASNGEWFAIDWQTTANSCLLYAVKNGSGTARSLTIRYADTVSAILIPASSASAITISTYTATSAVTVGRVSIGGNCSATSGTHIDLLGAGTFSDGGTNSTTIINKFQLSPTINYTGATRSGAVQILKFAPVNTSLPTGNNAAVAFSATASALGGIHFHNQTDEVTNYELVRQYYTGNVFTIESTRGGSGTLRDISFVLNNAANVVSHISTATITGGVTDGYIASLRITPTYTAATAQTVTRHNYIDANQVTLSGAGPAALTDACLVRFNAAAGTHKAVDAASTKVTVTGVDGWIKFNVNGTLFYCPMYLSKTA